MTRFIIQESPIHGQGMFAAREICAGEVILVWEECKANLTEGDLERLSPAERKRVSLIDGQIVLFKPPACWVNHSCDPNARGAGGRDIAIRPITRGEEITVDYLAECVPDLNFACTCSSQSCRGQLTSPK